MRAQRQKGSNRRQVIIIASAFAFTILSFSGMVHKLELEGVKAKQRSRMNITQDDTLHQSAELEHSRSNCTLCDEQKQDIKLNSHLAVPAMSGRLSYRLGDGVKGYDRRSSDKGLVCKLFPGTILCEYLQRTDEKGDYSVLQDIVREWSAGKWNYLEKPGVNSTVVHLRLGDSLCQYFDRRPNCNIDSRSKLNRSNSSYFPSCWEDEWDCNGGFEHDPLYAYPRDYYKPVVTDLLESVGRNTTIVIVSDPSHWGGRDPRNGNYSIDMAYRDNVRSFFQSNGFVTRVYNSTGVPDYDFVYMSLAKYFIRGGGGYSHYVAEVVTANGGRVFEPRLI